MLVTTIKLYNQDIFFVLIVLSLFLTGLIKGVYWKHAKLLFMGVFAQRYTNQYLREDNGFTERVNLLTFLLMCINYTLVIAKFQNVNDFVTIVVFLFLVGLYFVLKIIVIKLLSILFKVYDLNRVVVFFSLLFDKTLGFILFPLLVGLYFFSFDISTGILFVSVCLFVFIFILKLFWLWKIALTLFSLSRVYIFLYICLLEICPLLLIGKRFFIK